ncbi:MAG: hypothetical protein PVG65_00530 [Candidatus Thorarchaeota archaeon]|jgi:hypothetical protein
MPYIDSKTGRRKKLQCGEPAENAGELNYQIFWFIKHFHDIGELNKREVLDNFVKKFLGKTPNYQKYNDMTGCLILCYKEIKRRLNYKEEMLKEILDSYDKEIAGYENIKISINGDVA